MVRYPAEARTSLLRAIRSTEPKLASEAFAELVATQTGQSRSEVSDVIETLVSMYIAMDRESIGVREFSSGVCEALQAESIQPEGGDWASFKGWLSELLSLDVTLGVTAKAQGLCLEYEYTFCQARILTDFRPVFKHDPHEAPAVGLITHQIRLAVHTSEAEVDKEFYISMDHEDLVHLRDLAERAIAKEASLKSFIEKAGMKILET